MQRKWTAEEEATLIRMVQEKCTAKKAAIALDRSVGSIWQKVHVMRRKGMPALRFAAQPGLLRLEHARAHPLVRKVLRRALHDGYTFKRLARQAGVSWGTIRDWDRSSPKVQNLEAVANVLGYRLVLVDERREKAA